MIKFDEKCLVRTTFDLGQRISIAESAKEMWNIVCTHNKDDKGSLMLRDPRLPVAVIHPKGSISITGNYSLYYACKSLKVIAKALIQANRLHVDPEEETFLCLFRVNYIIGRFRIHTDDDATIKAPLSVDSKEFSYETIQKLMGPSRGDNVIESGWNINMIDILLSKKYHWCVRHGITHVFSTKKSSKKYELEMEICKKLPPGAGTFNFRMNEHGEFRYTILLKEGEFSVSPESVVSEEEALDIERMQKDIDAAIVYLNEFIRDFYEDIMVPCKKQKLLRPGI